MFKQKVAAAIPDYAEMFNSCESALEKATNDFCRYAEIEKLPWRNEDYASEELKIKERND